MCEYRLGWSGAPEAIPTLPPPALPNPGSHGLAEARFGVLLAIGRPGLAFDFQFHQTLGGKADHLAQQIGVWGLLHERAQVHHVVGHRWLLESGWCQQPDPTGEPPVTTAKPSVRYGAIGGRACGRLCSTELHHLRGHDRPGALAEV